ncbi:Predicted arabinose efflux permease, MFS family [Reichenbachiella faecimaris]|uniref:Predicted arabinose efflux permease, MFS family n=1 Tax=Reichenbachiella faecimaris TaxID=692418 RepID=A0A1W2GRH6_REIFA|nr:MFS transporter [Reichenbachiella faecimaris]SMD38856.1 Predicted arabinose efflux permease, MFS family [Reichenbachiella faecimaris]
MLSLPKNVWVLALGLALMMSASSLVVFVGGLVGNTLAPSPNLATLPVAAIIVGTAFATIPVALLMRKLGRKKTFLSIIAYSVFISLLAAYSIHIQSFYLFCTSLALFGVSTASLNQFRFAAMESVNPEQIPDAASTVLLGGIVAAFVGPEIAVKGRNLFEYPFTGSFVLLAVLFVLGFAIISFFQNVKPTTQKQAVQGRPLSVIIKQPIFWTAVLCAMMGYAVMSFIMTATPVSMHVMDGHSLEDTKWVIQSHIVAMFLPSLITAWIIKKIGIKSMMLIGILAFAICLGIAYSGHHVGHYWGSLVLLGIGWNFLFIGGTTLLPQAYTDHERFKVQALNEFMIFGTQATAALSAGFVVHALGWETMLLTTIPLLLIPLVAILKSK